MFEDLKHPEPSSYPSNPGETGYLFPELAPVPPATKPEDSELLSPEPPPAMETGTSESRTPDATAETRGDVADAPSDDGALADWKAALRRDFEAWLEGVRDIDAWDSEPAEEDETPDLYSFYEELALANTEARKANRRTAEAFSQWGETLAAFQGQLGPLRDTVSRLAATQANENELPRPHCLALIELLDRLRRIAKAFEGRPSRKSWWAGNDAAWREVWEKQRQAVVILASHFEEMLKRDCISRMDVLGEPFDPLRMRAVAVEVEAGSSRQVVLEEVSPGYFRKGELLRPAEVKVSAPV